MHEFYLEQDTRNADKNTATRTATLHAVSQNAFPGRRNLNKRQVRMVCH